MRVVSLLPGATEMVAALGALEHLVGVTHECDHPTVVRSRVRVTESAVDSSGAASTVDAEVKRLHEGGAPLFTLLEDRIRSLHPDLILTQALCDVCAVSEADVRALAARLDPAPEIVTLSGTTLDGVLTDLSLVGRALQLSDETEEWLAGALARMSTVHSRLKSLRAPRPSVAVIEWTDPVYAAGHWVPEMIHKAGGVDVLATAGEHSVERSVHAVRTADPEVMIIAPCGYDLERAASEGARLLRTDAWAWARDRRVWAVDANAFVSRPGPRLVDGIELFARIFNPSAFTPLDPTFARPLTDAARLT